ncbi:hypothetical protein VNO78_28996 [Psophocarpus tetragonolobus]|uniref:Uncharacterized protein n=1 Tax=Psophocarpus tetragonolobus TaxID=3891 RepID=A0AAN9RU50_PSOTE
MEQNNPNSTEEALTRILHDLSAELDNEEMDQFCFEEEKVKEMMKELYKEITFSSNHVSSPNPSLFINDAKNGSCGVLISSSKSTIMAGIEVVSSTSRFPVTKKGSTKSRGKTLFKYREEKNGKRKNKVRDEDHLDCEWVGSVLKKWWSLFDT